MAADLVQSAESTQPPRPRLPSVSAGDSSRALATVLSILTDALVAQTRWGIGQADGVGLWSYNRLPERLKRVHDLLADPVPGRDPYLWREALCSQFVRTSNCLISPRPALMRGRPPRALELVRVLSRPVVGQPDRVWVQPTMGVSDQERSEERSRLLGLHGAGYDPVRGRSPSPLEEAFQAQFADAQAHRVHRNLISGGLWGGNSIDEKSEAEEYLPKAASLEGMRAAIEEGYAGVDNAGQTLPILPIGYEPGGRVTTYDVQLLEVLRFTALDVCGRWRLPVVFLGLRPEDIPQKEAFEALEGQAVQPWARRIAQTFSWALLTAEERQRWGVVLDTSEVALPSAMARAVLATQGVANAGLWSVDQGRELTGCEPLAGNRGDQLYSPRGNAPAREGIGGQPTEEV